MGGDRPTHRDLPLHRMALGRRRGAAPLAAPDGTAGASRGPGPGSPDDRPENARPSSALWPGETRSPEWAKEQAVQMNSAGGDQQQEVSEKRLAPGTFPCRLDVEALPLRGEAVGGPRRDPGHPVAVPQPGDHATTNPSQVRPRRTGHQPNLWTPDGPGRRPWRRGSQLCLPEQYPRPN